MKWTHLSFTYLFTYLLCFGLCLLVAPQFSLRLLGATGDYTPGLAQFLAAFMLALGIAVLQIARYRAEKLYPTVLLVRVPILGTIIWLYLASRDPLFIVLAGVVGVGMVLTGVGLIADRKGQL